MSAPASLTVQAVSPEVGNAHTLFGEHARLMRDVERRTAPVQALLGARTWPHAELGALTSLLRSTVLRQISDEEVHLFPHDASAPPFAELTTEHLRLRALTAQLEKARAERCPITELRGLVNELLDTLRSHLEAEQQVLAALPLADGDVPAAACVAATNQPWLPDDSPVRIDLDSLPANHAIELCIERLLRLAPGQTAEVLAKDERLLRSVGRWLHDFDRTRFGLDHQAAVREHLLRVTSRQANTSAGIGYPG